MSHSLEPEEWTSQATRRTWDKLITYQSQNRVDEANMVITK